MKIRTTPDSGRANLRVVVALIFCSAAALLAAGAIAQNQTKAQTKLTRAEWPTLSDQLAKQYDGRTVQAGTALETSLRGTFEVVG